MKNILRERYVLNVYLRKYRGENELELVYSGETNCPYVNDALTHFRVALSARVRDDAQYTLTQRTLYRAICEKLFFRKNCATLVDHDSYAEIVVIF